MTANQNIHEVLIAEVRWLRWLVERVASLTAEEIAEREQVEQLVADARALLATNENAQIVSKMLMSLND